MSAPIRLTSAGLLLAPVCLGLVARAQEPKKFELPKLGGADDGKQEMVELFHKVEKRLSEIDRLLYDASSGEKKLSAQQESGISELLKSSGEKSQEVVRDIDRILEIASKNGGSCSSTMAGSQPSQGKSQGQGSPLDKPGEPQSARENTPEKPGGQPESQKPGGEEPDPSQPKDGQPRSPRDSDADPHSRRGAPPTGQETARTDAAQQTERWGDLPQHVRDLFRTEGGGDMPPQYRDWIDAYYRRLNQRP